MISLLGNASYQRSMMAMAKEILPAVKEDTKAHNRASEWTED
jgi:hypothetical protein